MIDAIIADKVLMVRYDYAKEKKRALDMVMHWIAKRVATIEHKDKVDPRFGMASHEGGEYIAELI